MGNRIAKWKVPPEKARMCVWGAFEEIVSPLSSPCPTHSGSAGVEEERRPSGGEGGCWARVIHFRHLWLRRWALVRTLRRGLVEREGQIKPSKLGGRE